MTLLDTADVYGGNPAPARRCSARRSKGRRDEFVVATKFGMDMQGANGADHGVRGSRRYVRRAVEAQPAAAADRPHRPLPAARARPGDADRGDPVGARPSWSARARSATSAAPTSPAGRSPTPTGPRGPRASSASSRCRTATPCSTATVEGEVVPACERFGLGVLPYFPLEYGLLTGKYRRGEAAPDGLARRPRRRAAPLARARRLGPHRGADDVRRGARRLAPRRRHRRARRPAGRRVGDLGRDPRRPGARQRRRAALGADRRRPGRARRGHRRLRSRPWRSGAGQSRVAARGVPASYSSRVCLAVIEWRSVARSATRGSRSRHGPSRRGVPEQHRGGRPRGARWPRVVQQTR